MNSIEVRSSGPGPSFKTTRPVDGAKALDIMHAFALGLLVTSAPGGVAVIIRRVE